MSDVVTDEQAVLGVIVHAEEFLSEARGWYPHNSVLLLRVEVWYL